MDIWGWTGCGPIRFIGLSRTLSGRDGLGRTLSCGNGHRQREMDRIGTYKIYGAIKDFGKNGPEMDMWGWGGH